MARLARVVVPGVPHHITHRGNRRADVFLDDADRVQYLKHIGLYSERHGMRIWSYCLMPNHIHFLAVPLRGDTLALAIGRAHMQHARLINKRNRWTGHLWENRFYSSVVGPRGVAQVARYIELNPVRAGLVGDACDYPWSSARASCGRGSDPLLDPERNLTTPAATWAEWLQEAIEREQDDAIRRNTLTGRPIGGESFVSDLEADMGRRLTRRTYQRHDKETQD